MQTDRRGAELKYASACVRGMLQTEGDVGSGLGNCKKNLEQQWQCSSTLEKDEVEWYHLIKFR